MTGKFIEVNDNLVQLFGVSRESILTKFQGDFDSPETVDPEKHKKLWDDLRSGITRKAVQHIMVAGKDIWLSEAYTPVLDRDGTPYKIVNLAVDVTESMKNQT